MNRKFLALIFGLDTGELKFSNSANHSTLQRLLIGSDQILVFFRNQIMQSRPIATLLLSVSLTFLPQSLYDLCADDGPQTIQKAAEKSPMPKNESVPDGQEKSATDPNWNLPLRTVGGTQLWTDHLHRSGYRLQRNALTGHWRLLDSSDVRRAWGTRQQCVDLLDQKEPKPESDGNPQHQIVLLHGLMRTRTSMKTLETKLAEEGHSDTIRFSYASTRSSIGDHAEALRETLEDFPTDTTFSFVGHSMGNIVVRHLVGDLQRDGDPKKILSRCKSMVMLGPPNQGAAISRWLAPTGLYGWITGKGGLELGPEWDSFVQKLATPPFPFAIIAGDVSQSLIQNPLVGRSGDLVVSLEETDLEGRQWLKTVPVLHSFLMDDLVTMSMTIEFIESHL